MDILLALFPYRMPVVILPGKTYSLMLVFITCISVCSARYKTTLVYLLAY